MSWKFKHGKLANWKSDREMGERKIGAKESTFTFAPGNCYYAREPKTTNGVIADLVMRSLVSPSLL